MGAANVDVDAVRLEPADRRTRPVGRLVRSTDFERVLRSRSRASSSHFAVHHLAQRPSTAQRALPKPALPGSAHARPIRQDLLTLEPPTAGRLVDDLTGACTDLAPLPLLGAACGIWLGAVVPKRHARRSVTRALLKRQIRAAVQRQASLAAGLWVVRLRAPFDRACFPSAASQALRIAARTELDSVLARAAGR